MHAPVNTWLQLLFLEVSPTSRSPVNPIDPRGHQESFHKYLTHSAAATRRPRRRPVWTIKSKIGSKWPETSHRRSAREFKVGFKPEWKEWRTWHSRFSRCCRAATAAIARCWIVFAIATSNAAPRPRDYSYWRRLTSRSNHSTKFLFSTKASNSCREVGAGLCGVLINIIISAFILFTCLWLIIIYI